MTDTAPGAITDAHGWPGRWETITRGEYWGIIHDHGGLEVLSVHSACTRPGGENYILTAWGLRNGRYPLVQNVLEDCDGTDPAACPGTHTFQRFIYDPEDDDDA